MNKNLAEIYKILLREFGKQNWWPAKSKGRGRQFEISVGAILTQNTNWKNVEKAIENLRGRGMLNDSSIRNTEPNRLAPLIKSSGYYNQKAKKLRAFAEFLKKCSFEDLRRMDTDKSREALLKVHGIGKETADSILLYAMEKPVFVVDAYTKRAFQRLMPKETSMLKEYDEWRRFFEENIGKDQRIFNEYHALIVELGKNFCKTEPLCNNCPLNKKCKNNHCSLPVSSGR